MNKCRVCDGHKYIYGMGNMREKCKSCEGQGFIKKAVVQKEVASNQKKEKKGSIDV